MNSIVAPFRVLGWFISQAVMVGGVGFDYFVIPFLIVAGILLFFFLRQERNLRKRLVPLILFLPLIWIFVGLWGGFFWNNRPGHVPQTPSWVGYMPLIVLGLYLLVAGYYIWRLAGARLFVVGYALMNLYFMLAMYVLAAMAISGDWL